MTVIGTGICGDRGANVCTVSVARGASAHDEQNVIIPIIVLMMRNRFLFFIL